MVTNTKHYPGSGDVKITISDETFTMRPTLDAALTLSRQSGGIRQAITKVLDLDLDTIVGVVRLGIGRDEAKRLKNLDKMIWENGLLDAQGELVSRCVEYLSNLARGGRSADDVLTADDDGAGGEGDRPTPKTPLQ